MRLKSASGYNYLLCMLSISKRRNKRKKKIDIEGIFLVLVDACDFKEKNQFRSTSFSAHFEVLSLDCVSLASVAAEVIVVSRPVSG